MIGCENLHGGANLRAITDADGDDIEYHAVEIEKDAGAEADVETVIAIKWRPDHGTFADKGQALHQELPPFCRRGAERRIVARKPAVGGRQLCLQRQVTSIV